MYIFVIEFARPIRCLAVSRYLKLRTQLNDKRNDINFPIVNLPFMCSNIPTTPAYGIYISLLIRYFRVGDSLDRGLLLTRKLPNHSG
jgi:hypothetical protein